MHDYDLGEILDNAIRSVWLGEDLDGEPRAIAVDAIHGQSLDEDLQAVEKKSDPKQ